MEDSSEYAYHTSKDGSKFFMEEKALAQLLEDRVLFPNTRQYMCPSTKTLQPATIVLFVNCNDTFGWACADAEDVSSMDELEELYQLWFKDKKWGSTQWVIKKRKAKPIEPLIERMKEEKVWLEEFDKFD